MECNQQQTKVAVTKTLYENFWEEKCECDLLIPDYFPAAEKIIQCSASSVITEKQIENDRLNIQGICRFYVIYQGEEGEVKALNENVTFDESFLIKEIGKNAWVQTAVRVSGASCRLLNPRKISTKATISLAVKVKNQEMAETIEEVDCDEIEVLFAPVTVYTVTEHFYDTARVQGEIEVHTEIQDILKAQATVCVKDVKLLPNKAVVKGVVDVFVLFTPESDPSCVESTSTAIPFSQILDLGKEEVQGAEVSTSILNLRCDVETDNNGKNKIISLMMTIQTEGEAYENKPHCLLQEVYSNRYPLNCTKGHLYAEELIECGKINDVLHHSIPWESENTRVIQAFGVPTIQKVTGKGNTLTLEGVIDASLFVQSENQYRSIDKVIPFTVSKEVKMISEQMRCEVQPIILGMGCGFEGDHFELKTEFECSVMIFSKKSYEVIEDIQMDREHPMSEPMQKLLVVYFADKGERIWDIAKKYATSVSVIKNINAMDADVVEEKRLLLISKN